MPTDHVTLRSRDDPSETRFGRLVGCGGVHVLCRQVYHDNVIAINVCWQLIILSRKLMIPANCHDFFNI